MIWEKSGCRKILASLLCYSNFSYFYNQSIACAKGMIPARSRGFSISHSHIPQHMEEQCASVAALLINMDFSKPRPQGTDFRGYSLGMCTIKINRYKTGILNNDIRLTTPYAYHTFVTSYFATLKKFNSKTSLWQI